MFLLRLVIIMFHLGWIAFIIYSDIFHQEYLMCWNMIFNDTTQTTKYSGKPLQTIFY